MMLWLPTRHLSAMMWFAVSDHLNRGPSNGLRACVEEERIPQRFLKALLDVYEKCNIRDLDLRCRTRVKDANSGGQNNWETCRLVQDLLAW
jgi:hypothetical protein